MKRSPPIEAVVFDVGGVLLDWNPRYLYRKLFATEQQMERFLSEVCTREWHAQHDRGARVQDACAELAAKHPDEADLIWAWAQRSEEMIGGAIDGSVEILKELRGAGVSCYLLTNMESHTWPLRLVRYPFLGCTDGALVSAFEGVMKPDREIFERLLRRFGLDAARTVLIDDQPANLEAARACGLQTVLFRSPAQLRAWLTEAGLLSPR